MGLKNKMFWESARRNDYSYIYYYNKLCNMAVSAFKWSGLPDSIDERFLELTLFAKGSIAFFNDEEMGLLALPAMMNGTWSIYNVPNERVAYATNSYQRRLNQNDSVLVFNNYMRRPDMQDCEMFADRLWDLDRSIAVNARAQKTPIIITCDESQKLTMLNLYKEYDGNMPVIFGQKGLNLEGIKALQPSAPFVGDKLYDLKANIWNEAMMHLGITNVHVNKKGNMTTQEVMRTMGGTIASRYSKLEMRRMGCEQINNMFGTDIWCDYRQDVLEDAEDGGLPDSEVDTE